MTENSFEFIAELRQNSGTADSRRLRHAGKVPAVIYGGKQDIQHLTLVHKDVMKNLQTEAVYSHILQVKIGDQTQQAILKDLQRHPFRKQILHVDFQRVSATEEITVDVPLHIIGEAACPGIKQFSGKLSRLINEVAVSCLPAKLPEYIEVDISRLELNQSVHLSELKLPEGVALTALAQKDFQDQAVLSINPPIVEAAETPTAVEEPTTPKAGEEDK